MKKGADAARPNHGIPRRAGDAKLSAVTETPQIDVRRLAASELSAHLDGLAAVLADCVAGGASVSYMEPFTHADARAQFEAWAAEVERGTAIESAGPRRSKKSSPRQKWLIAGLVLLAAGVLGMILTSVMWLARPGTQPVARFSILPPPGQQRSLTEAQVSPDGKYVVFASRRGELTQLFIRPLDQFEARPIIGTEGAVRPFFSPDSRWIGFFQGESRLTSALLCPCRGTSSTAWRGTQPVLPSESWILRQSPRSSVTESSTPGWRACSNCFW